MSSFSAGDSSAYDKSEMVGGTGREYQYITLALEIVDDELDTHASLFLREIPAFALRHR